MSSYVIGVSDTVMLLKSTYMLSGLEQNNFLYKSVETTGGVL